MRFPLETRTLGQAVLAAALSLGGAWLAAGALRKAAASGPAAPPAFYARALAASPEEVARGRGFYLLSCSQCHGDDARGDEGPDLYRLRLSDAHLAATLERGIKGEMPSFAKKYDRAQIESLVVYLRSLR